MKSEPVGPKRILGRLRALKYQVPQKLEVTYRKTGSESLYTEEQVPTFLSSPAAEPVTVPSTPFAPRK